MSAYLCTVDHISACADILKAYQAKGYPQWQELPQSTEAIFILLVEANIRSLRARYSECSQDEVSASGMNYKPQTIEDPTSSRIGLATYVLPVYFKALQCFDYQSCETPGYADSLVGRAIADAKAFLASAIIRHLKTYEDADWGWKASPQPVARLRTTALRG